MDHMNLKVKSFRRHSCKIFVILGKGQDFLAITPKACSIKNWINWNSTK